MNTRCLLLPAIFITLFTVSWAPAGGDLPQSPVPREKKMTAEQLIGTWKIVKLDGQKAPEDWLFAMEFTTDGKLNVFSNRPTKARIGTYKLTGETIRFHIPADVDDPESKGEIAIISITENQLEIISRSKNLKSEEVLQRVNP